MPRRRRWSRSIAKPTSSRRTTTSAPTRPSSRAWSPTPTRPPPPHCPRSRMTAARSRARVRRSCRSSARTCPSAVSRDSRVLKAGSPNICTAAGASASPSSSPAAPGAMRAVCVSRNEVPADLIERERAIYTAQAADSGKPADIVAKMVEGRINKFLAEVTLLGQPFVKNPDETVDKYLKAKGATVTRFVLYVVGEGIEKKGGDFAAEVAAMVKG